MVRAGVHVGLGVDGSASNDASDLRMETKQSVLSSRTRDGAGAMPVRPRCASQPEAGPSAWDATTSGRLSPARRPILCCSTVMSWPWQEALKIL